MMRVMLVSAVLIAASAAQAQGFFEYFFGGFVPPPPPQMRPFNSAPRPAPPMAYVQPAPMPNVQRNPYTDGLSPGQEPSSKPEKAPPPPVGPGPLGPFLIDPTLRAGDVVVTVQGLYVYRGPSGLEHKIGDFVPLARASVKNAQLVAIDRATRKGKPPIR